MIDASQYRQGADGNLVPIKNIKESDLLRDQIVIEMTEKAKELQAQMKSAKARFFEDFHSFVALSAEKYKVKLGGRKGNVTLYSFDGKYRIELRINERIELDERIHAAKVLIDECILEWASDSNSNLTTLIKSAFRVDDKGNVNSRRILELRNYEIEDSRWNRAMEAISDSIMIASSKEYMRFAERQENGEYQYISLDFAAV